MILLKLSIAVLIACVGAGTSLSELNRVWFRPALLLRSLAAMYVLVPLVAFGLVLVMPIERGVKAALLTLAVSAGAPLLPKRLKRLQSRDYVFGLLILSSLVAIVAVPVWTALLSAYFDVELKLRIGTVVSDIGKTILLPVMLGMGLRFAFPAASSGCRAASCRLRGSCWPSAGLPC